MVGSSRGKAGNQPLHLDLLQRSVAYSLSSLDTYANLPTSTVRFYSLRQCRHQVPSYSPCLSVCEVVSIYTEVFLDPTDLEAEEAKGRKALAG
jgi:hypothetical protein